MTKKNKYLLLAGILIIATFLRFYHLTTTPPGLYPDEAMDGANAQNVAQTGNYKVYYPEDNGREGLYVNILAVAFKYHLLPETAPWSVRFPAAVAGVLTVLGTYLLISELFGAEAGLLATFFLATSFWHINFSRIGFRAILAPLLLVWPSYLLLKAFRSPSPHPSNPNCSFRSVLYAAIGGALYGLGFYTYIAFRITPLLVLFFIPFFRKTPGFWRMAAVFVLFAFLVALPIGWYYLKHPADFFGRTSEISVSNSKTPIADLFGNIAKTALMFNWHGDYNWRQNVSGAPELWWPVGILFLIGIVMIIKKIVETTKAKGLREEISRTSFAPAYITAWFLIGALPEVLSDEGIPHALRSLLMVIPAMTFAAVGGLWLYRLLLEKWHPAFVRALGVAFIAAVAAAGYITYFVTWAENPNVPGAFSANYVTIGDEINALPAAVQKYVVVDAGGVVDYGIPLPATTVMYVTDSFVPDAAAQKDVRNIHYLLPNETDQIPDGTPSSTIFYLE